MDVCQRIDQMQPRGERFSSHFAEKIDNSHLPGRNHSRRAQQQEQNENEKNKRERRSPRFHVRQLKQSAPKLSKIFAGRATGLNRQDFVLFRSAN